MKGKENLAAYEVRMIYDRRGDDDSRRLGGCKDKKEV